MTKIKICGIKTIESAVAAAEAGADFIGLVFAQSPHQVTPTQANKIITALKLRAKVPGIVGVFVNTPSEAVNQIAEFCSLDRVQLSGDETFEYCRGLKPATVKVMRVNRLHKAEQVCQDMSAWVKGLYGKDNIFLLDAYDPDKFGGTGNLLDWKIAAYIAEKYRVIVAGGLTPDNVGDAIKKIKPWGVDVSSGVETGGEKDMNKIKDFIKAAREADAVIA